MYEKGTAYSGYFNCCVIGRNSSYYFMPKKFGKNVNPSEVDHINVFDGNTGTGFTITDSEDIEYIVANIQGISMKRDGISLGRTPFYHYRPMWHQSCSIYISPV